MWDLLLDDDERTMADAVHEYLKYEAPLDRLRGGRQDGIGSASVQAGLVDLGWLGVGLPESVGGSGLGVVEEILVQRECGRQLVGPGALASVLGAHAAVQAGENELAIGIVAGRVSPALALHCRAIPPGADGEAFLFDWSPGDPLLICTPDGVGLFEPDALSEVRADVCLDESVSQQRGMLAGQPRIWIDRAEAPLAERAQVLLAAALVGLAEQSCEMAVEYAKVRQQFGRPIGSFQAIKHRCADMGVRVRLAWYQTSLAALMVQTSSDAALHAASAKLLAARAAHENGHSAIQVHGGIGFQAECDVHWFMKRAHLYDQVGGNLHTHALRIAAQPSPLW